MEGGCSIDAALKGCFRDRRRLACRIVRAQRRPPIDGADGPLRASNCRMFVRRGRTDSCAFLTAFIYIVESRGRLPSR